MIGESPEYVCWDRSFVGAVWMSGHDQTSGAVICKPIGQVAELGEVTARLASVWRTLSGLPIPIP